MSSQIQTTTQGQFREETRKFVNLSHVSQYLYCAICQEIFTDAHRMKCGHTFCRECIVDWCRYSNKCPICRMEIDINKAQRDLIGCNMVGELEVFCSNKHCPWKGKCQDLDEHLRQCNFDPKKLPQFIRDAMSKEHGKKAKSKEISQTKNNPFRIEANKEDDDNEDDTLSNENVGFNTSIGLKARLYQKDPNLMKQVFSKKAFQPMSKKDEIPGDLYGILGIHKKS